MNIFFDTWYCKNGCLCQIISECNKIFVSKFWKALMKLTRIHHKLSTSYHPEMDGSQECTNKVVQCLRYHMEQNQKGGPKPCQRSVSISWTLLTCQWVSLHSYWKLGTHHICCPSIAKHWTEIPMKTAAALIVSIQNDILSAWDSMLAAKILQAHQANLGRAPDPVYHLGSCMLLAMACRRHEYMQAKDGQAVKFMPRFDGLYDIMEAYPESSAYKLDLPPASKHHLTFHVAQLCTHIPNDTSLFPAHELQ